MNSQWRARPILGELLESRALCAGLAGGAVVHLILVGSGLGGWPCPWRKATGMPCPGCGLGHAGVLLLRGEVAESLRVHAFAGPFFVALAVILPGAIAPERWRKRLVRHVSDLERAVPILPVLLLALLIYWLARLSLDGGVWIQLEGLH